MVYEKSCGAVVFTKAEGEIRYLLITNREGIYGFPKGHVEGNETERETALREVREETGLKIQLIENFRTMDEHPIPKKKDTLKQIVYFLGSFDEQDIQNIVHQEEEVSAVVLSSYSAAMDLFQFEGSKRILKEANDYLMQMGIQ